MSKLLLVEDNENNRIMLSRRLQSRGYEVIFAVNGAEGVSKTLSEKPDLLLMDMNLPVLDGWEATRQLKANFETQDIPIIALTAHTMAGDKEKTLEAGCDDYDSKPIDLPRLLEKIERLLKKRVLQKSETLCIPQDSRIQRALLSHLRHELCTPMNAIVGYSEMLLDELKSQSNSELFYEIQKIYDSGNQLLSLVNLILDPDRLKVSKLDQNLDSVGSSLRLEMLTPLSTIIGYCEMLLEDATDELIPDLLSIQAATEQLLSMVNDIVSLAQQQLQAIDEKQLATTDLMLSSLMATNLMESAATTIRTLNEVRGEEFIRGGRLLIVDDNESNCNLLSRQLERQGYVVATATRGQEALSMLAAQSYDLILLDIIMPGMSGFEVLHQLKNHSQWRQIPVLVISSLDEIDRVVRCIEMGAEDYLSKPFKPVLLRAKIGACLEKKRLREQQVLHLAQQLIAEATPVPVLISRLEDGAIIYANTTASSTFGLPVEELLVRRVHDFYFNPCDRGELVKALSQAQSIQNWELQCKRADGTPFWVRASFQQLTFNGEATILSALCDITDRKCAEEALRLAEEKYRSIFENALEGIFQSTPDGRFISINPGMARIFGYTSSTAMIETVTEIDHQIYVDPNSREEFRSLLEKQGEVKGFEYQVYRQYGDIIWVCESTRAVRDSHGQLLYYEGILDDVTQRKLQEVALKREVEELRIEIDATKRDRQVAEMTDNEYFRQLQATVENLRFQDDTEPEPVSEVETQPTVPKVLLVEDNELNREMLSRRLQRLGYEVLVAVHGAEGVSKTVTEKPDIVLMDMSLPVMDGWEATRQIKANPQTRNIPVIALTAHAMKGDREKALYAGCDEYDTKPIKIPRLLSKIKTLLEKNV